jgi:DNA polymerase family A
MTQLIDLGLDFETFYDGDYSLRKMENAQYVMDSRFEVIGFSLKLPGQPAQWYSGTMDYLKGVLSNIPWHKVRVIAHNVRFDGAILEWRFGFKPAAYLCTMVGSRPHFVPKTGSASLDSIGQHLKLQAKGNAVHKMLGKHRDDLTPDEMREYGIYCAGDTEIACGIADELNRVLPIEEQQLIDLTLKKYLRPRLRLDGAKLIDRINALDAERNEMLARIERDYKVNAATLRSRDKFAKVLEGLGVPPPMKASKPTKTNPQGGQTYAFAKDDLAFKELLIHPDIRVRELCHAKLTMSSSLEQSRLRRLLDLHNTMDGMLPVPMVYYGAHTGRFSGDEKINLQNLPRVEWDKATKKLKKGHLRFALRAQPGYSVIAADFSNIEARIVATLAGQDDLVEKFRNGEDIYSWFATLIYGYPVNKKDHPLERFVGKTCILGLGYGMGWKKFLLKMLQEGVQMDEKEARRIVYLYRDTFPKIKQCWETLDALAAKFLTDPTGMYIWKNLMFMHERIILPNGMPIMYPDIAKGPEGLYFRSRKFKALSEDEVLDWQDGNRIWGGSFLENICQALARIIATRSEMRLASINVVAALQAHDELVFHVPTKLVDICKRAIEHEMTKSVDWMPNLPIAVEMNHGESYGDAK